VTRKSKFLRSFLRLSGCFSLAAALVAAVATAHAAEPSAEQEKRLRFKIYDRDVAQGADVVGPVLTKDFWGNDVLCAQVVLPGGRREPAYMTLDDFWWWQDTDRVVLPTLEPADSTEQRRFWLTTYVMSGCATALSDAVVLKEFAPKEPKIKQWLEAQNAARVGAD
jgi:hypothetical protein